MVEVDKKEDESTRCGDGGSKILTPRKWLEKEKNQKRGDEWERQRYRKLECGRKKNVKERNIKKKWENDVLDNWQKKKKGGKVGEKWTGGGKDEKKINKYYIQKNPAKKKKKIKLYIYVIKTNHTFSTLKTKWFLRGR